MAKIIEEQHQEKAVFVGVIKQNDDERQVMEYLDELEFLAETAGVRTTSRFISTKTATWSSKWKRPTADARARRRNLKSANI